MFRRVRLLKDGAGFVLHFVEGKLEETERIPASEGDRLFYARVKELGLSESADLLLKDAELVVKNGAPRRRESISRLRGEEAVQTRRRRGCATEQQGGTQGVQKTTSAPRRRTVLQHICIEFLQ